MTYGVRFTNTSGVTVVDSEFARLCVLHKGTWANASTVVVNFPQVVTTTEPPLVFVRPDSYVTFCFCLVLGSPGAWTGFRFIRNGTTVTTGKWFCAAFKASPVASYGFRIWNGAAGLIFDSGTPCAQFTRNITGWSYLGASMTSQGIYRYAWSAPSPLDGGDYMLLNNVAMDIAGVVSRQGNLYATWDFPNNRLLMEAIGVDLPSAFLMPVVFAKQIV